MQEKKQRLVASAAELCRLGIEVEAARAQLQKLIEQGAAYESDEVTAAVLRFQSLQARWSAAEAEYLCLREEIVG